MTIFITDVPFSHWLTSAKGNSAHVVPGQVHAWRQPFPLAKIPFENRQPTSAHHNIGTHLPASWIVEPTHRASKKKVPNRFPPRTLPCSLSLCGHANLFLSPRLHLMSCQIRLIAQTSLLDGNYPEKWMLQNLIVIPFGLP